MKIAVFIKQTTFHANYGGMETQNVVLCEGLVKRGHKVTVFSPKRELKLTQESKNGVDYVFVDCEFRHGWFFGFFGKNNPNNWVNRSVEEFTKIHNTDKFDLVLGQSSAALGVIRSRELLNIRVVSISHGSILSEMKTRLNNLRSPRDYLSITPSIAYALKVFFTTQREFVHGSRKIVAVSNWVKDAIVDETYADKEKIAVIYNSVDASGFTYVPYAGSETESVKIIYAGKLISAKGVFQVLEVFRDPVFSKSQLIFVGDGDAAIELKKTAAVYGLTQRVQFTGNISWENVLQKITESDVFVLPSLRFEGLPMTVLEAMLAGRAVVAADIGGISDAVVDNITGCLFKSGDSGALKKILIELMESPKKRCSLAEAARYRAISEFSADTMLNKYEKVFEEVLK